MNTNLKKSPCTHSDEWPHDITVPNHFKSHGCLDNNSYVIICSLEEIKQWSSRMKARVCSRRNTSAMSIFIHLWRLEAQQLSGESNTDLMCIPPQRMRKYCTLFVYQNLKHCSKLRISQTYSSMTKCLSIWWIVFIIITCTSCSRIVNLFVCGLLFSIKKGLFTVPEKLYKTILLITCFIHNLLTIFPSLNV